MKINKLFFGFLLLILGISCNDDFNEINKDNQGFDVEDVSAKFFLTGSQFGLYAPNRTPYWRAFLIYADRFSGHAAFGSTISEFVYGFCYNFIIGVSDIVYNWMAGHFGNIKSFGDLTKPGGDFENEYMYAMSLIMKGLYFQMYTETYGMVSFSEAGVDGILTPKYDTQKDVYKGIIADLDAAMATIGDADRTGTGINDVGSNDVYCGGDLQQWKRLANTLKLRIGMRALGAPGDDFANGAITAALSAPLLGVDDSVLMAKDYEISEWTSSSYGDVWHDFGGTIANWTIGDNLINLLDDNNDPRLAKYAKPVGGGSFLYSDPGGDPNYADRLNLVIQTLDDANANYTINTSGADTTIDVESGQFIGQPVRANAETKSFLHTDIFSYPSDAIIQPRGQQAVGYPEIIFSSANSYFLQAEAALRGIGSGDAQALYEAGITEAMTMWGLSEGDAATYINNEAMGDISTGTMEEKLEKIALQRYIASYTDSFEAWAIVRKTGYPSELTAGVANTNVFALGELNGAYPQRLRYGSGAQANPNYTTAVSSQGADVQGTTLWFAQ